MSMPALQAHFRAKASQAKLFEAVKADGPGKWAAIKKIYAIQQGRGYSPYFVDWPEVFTPIEKDAWHYIRMYGLPMFPQYPIGRFFVDFGDPCQRIAIECDGKAFHDEAKDRKRDAALLDQGWTVYRFSGSALWKGEDRPGSAKAGFLDIAKRHYSGGE